MTWQYFSKGRITKDARRLVVEKEGYGPNWHRQKWACLQRDNFQCQKCGHLGKKKPNGLWDVSVHHVRKVKFFVDQNGIFDYERANSLDNLITLCEVNLCHKNADGHSNSGNWVRL